MSKHKPEPKPVHHAMSAEQQEKYQRASTAPKAPVVVAPEKYDPSDLVFAFRALKAACEQKAGDIGARYRAFVLAYRGPSLRDVESFDAQAPETKRALMDLENLLRSEIPPAFWA